MKINTLLLVLFLFAVEAEAAQKFDWSEVLKTPPQSDQIVPGTIIVFDEFYNYPGYERHEFKAFQEFLARKGYKADYLAFNINHEQVAVRIHE
ncbi:MAG TPA: hypothetical protein VN457_04495 [Chlamydiales bacterium]|nr:hypothetical protein [Chlamydiales bacterium]